MLHGWGLGPQVWSRLRDALPPDLSVLAPELPGHGAAPPAARADIAGWSDTLLPDLPEHAVLCGWSLGGLIALDLAHRYPERVERLILIGSSPCFVSRSGEDAAPWPHGLDADTVDGFIASFAADPAITLRRFIALQALGDARRRTVGAGLNAALTTLDGDRAKSLADGLQLLANTDLRPIVRDIRQPVHIIHGAGDALMTATAARWLADHCEHSQLTLFDDCGHVPFLSRPDDCAALIAGALRD
nr:alpha/beta fold hydrolase [Aromatoleum diolicum]